MGAQNLSPLNFYLFIFFEVFLKSHWNSEFNYMAPLFLTPMLTLKNCCRGNAAGIMMLKYWDTSFQTWCWEQGSDSTPFWRWILRQHWRWKQGSEAPMLHEEVTHNSCNTQRKSFGILLSKPNLDCKSTVLIDLALNGIPFGGKTIGKA